MVPCTIFATGSTSVLTTGDPLDPNTKWFVLYEGKSLDLYVANELTVKADSADCWMQIIIWED